MQSSSTTVAPSAQIRASIASRSIIRVARSLPASMSTCSTSRVHQPGRSIFPRRVFTFRNLRVSNLYYEVNYIRMYRTLHAICAQQVDMSNGVTLTWNPPVDAGGEPVTNYVVEKRSLNADNQWVSVNQKVHDTFCYVNNLHTNDQVEFRVIAENKIGLSSPLTASESIKIKPPFSM